MIQATDHLVWVRAGEGRFIPFDPQRLAHSVHRALAEAGVPDTLLAESIAEAVYWSARDHQPAAICSPRDIQQQVETVLTWLGLPQVARAYGRRGGRTEICLDQVALAAGSLELSFYGQLAQHLATAADRQLQVVQVRGLRACVMRLAGARRWSRSCRRLADDIVAFIHARLRQVRSPPAAVPDLEVSE
jgi:hypothetical protein